MVHVLQHPQLAVSPLSMHGRLEWSCQFLNCHLHIMQSVDCGTVNKLLFISRIDKQHKLPAHVRAMYLLNSHSVAEHRLCAIEIIDINKCSTFITHKYWHIADYIHKHIPDLSVSTWAHRCKHLISFGDNPFCFVNFHFMVPRHLIIFLRIFLSTTNVKKINEIIIF